MARLPRLAIGGYPHLVAHKAASRRLIVDDEDARRLLDDLRLAMDEADVALHAFTLVPGDLWLLATPNDAGGLGRAMQSLGRRYVRWINDRRSERGGLFAGRYHAAVIEPAGELLAAMRYVEWQSVRAAAASAPEEYRWSSARHHLGLVSDSSLRAHSLYWALGNTPFERQAAYRTFLGTGPGSDEAARFERALAGGWVVGSPEFLRQIERLSPRRPQRARAGRPRRLPPAPAVS